MAQKEITKEKNRGHHVKIETTVIVSLITLVLGFFAAELMDFSTSKTRPPVQSSPAPQPQQLPETKGPTAEQAKRILALEKEVSENPGNGESWVQLGNSYFDTNQPAQAIRAYKKALELNPYDANVWTDLGVMYRRNGQPFEAVGALNKAIDLDPRHEVSRLNKGVILFHDLNDPEAAVEAWEDLLKVNPDAKTGDGKPVRDMVESIKKNKNQEQGS
jgi:cytochrome c-type biogenesis protein CcmH/NrfG